LSCAHWLPIAVLALLGSSAALPSAAQHQVTGPSADAPRLASGDAMLSGRVLHADGRVLADLDVALYALAPDGRPGIGGTKTDAEGRFRFENISGATGIVYLVGVRYGEIPYAQRAEFAAGETDLSVDFTVSDPLEDASALLVMQTRVQTEWIGAQLFLQVVHDLRNPDDRVLFVPEAARKDAAPVFSAALPKGARDFIDRQSGLGGGLIQEGEKLSFWGPVYPGDQEIRYGFLLDGPDPGQAANALDFVLPFPAGSGQVSLLVPESDPPPRGDRIPQIFVPEQAGESQLARYDLGGVGPGGEIAISLELAESSADADRLSITRADFWIDHDDTLMRVTAEYTLRVDSPSQLLARPGESLMHIALPEGAEFLGLSGVARSIGVVANDSGGLDLRGPIRHGESSLGFKYQVPVDAEAARLDLHFDRAVAQLNVLVADNGVAIETDRLHRRRPFKQGTRVYLHNQAYQIAAGESLAVVLRPLMQRGIPRRLALASGLAAAALAAFLLVGPLRQPTPEAGTEPESETALSVERESLYDSIRDLDHDYETGKLERAEFERMRRDLRAEAVDLLRQERRALANATPPALPTDEAVACPDCGEGVAATWQFCSRCGHDLRSGGDAG